MAPPTATLSKRDNDALEELKVNSPLYAERCLKIVDKHSRLIPFVYNEGQAALDAAVEAQRQAGKPRRALVLKARQIGFSTYVQAKLIQEATTQENQNAVVVAHDTKTGDKLFTMGQTMYGGLPDLSGLKPPVRSHRRGRFLHFAPPGAEAWQTGDLYPNSTYWVDTAGEFESGRGGTYQLAHLSEFAFWDRPVDKLTALLQAVPDTPDSLVIIESTANGVNTFRDMWQDAEEGKSDWIPFFWPWWKQAEYTLPFISEAEREAFESQIGQGLEGEDEPALLNPGPTDPLTSEPCPLTLEQLHWRRSTIANKCSGRLDKFRQEYPASPEEAFVSSGRQVFAPEMTRSVLISCELTDPRIPTEDHPGPEHGGFAAKGSNTRMGRTGTPITVPSDPEWKPRAKGIPTGSEDAQWSIWQQPEEGAAYIIACDPSSGAEAEGGSQLGTAYHAVQVIDHKTRKQVALYRSRVDPVQLAVEIYLAALYYNKAWVAVEITGGFGLPVIRHIFSDFGYPFVYMRHAHEQAGQPASQMLGWNTTKATKPLIEANLSEALREGTHGIVSRLTALEMTTYVRDPKGRTGPEAGRFSDLLIALMIAHQIANELPLRRANGSGRGIGYIPRDPITGY